MNTNKTAWAVISRYAADVKTDCELYATFEQAVERVTEEYTFALEEYCDETDESKVASFRERVINDHFAEVGDWEYTITEVNIPE